MKFSVVTPSFNQGKFISGCLHSVLEQADDVLLEHIILDNCSTDETTDILASYAPAVGSNFSSTVIVEKDSGQTNAINRGFNMASGDIICWLNTDERYRPHALAKVQAFFEEHPEIDVAFGDVEFVDADQMLIQIKKEHFYSPAMLLYYGCFIPSCSTFIRKTAAQRAGALDESMRVVMDFEWYLRLARSGAKFAPIREVLASFTWHDTNISSTFVDKRKAERFAVQERYSRLHLSSWLKRPSYWLLKYWWVGVRVLRRQLAGAHAN